MYNFNFYMPTKVLFGPGKLSELHSEQLPGKKALIAIGGQSVKKYGYLETLEKELDTADVEHVLFEGIRPNPTDMNVMEGLQLYPAKIHEVLGGDITADPLPLSDDDYLTIFENAWR